MKWQARLGFRADVACRVMRQSVDEKGVVIGVPIATPYCSKRLLALPCLEDDDEALRYLS